MLAGRPQRADMDLSFNVQCPQEPMDSRTNDSMVRFS